jgi:hypothetical protein
MARRRRRNTKESGFILLGFFIIAAISQVVILIVDFINTYSGQILFALIVTILGILLFFTLRFLHKKKKYQKLVDEYQKTPYFLDYKIPFKKLPENKGHLFEIEIYNRLKIEFTNSILIHLNLLIPKTNAFNEFSEIDLIVLHTSGVYVLEVKNFSGPVTGNDDDEYWKPFVQSVDGNDAPSYKQNYAIKGFSEFGLYNPIKQNEAHISYLKVLVDADYINKIIFSDSMLSAGGNHSKIYSLNGFVQLLKNSNGNKYSRFDLEDLYHKIDQVKITDPQAIKLHIARLSAKKRNRN